MIPRAELVDLITKLSLTEEVIEKDYVLGWLLDGIGRHQLLSDAWVFKGGTCLKKCYLETYRFSEDLDFSVTPKGLPTLGSDQLAGLLQELLRDVSNKSGIDFGGLPSSSQVTNSSLLSAASTTGVHAVHPKCRQSNLTCQARRKSLGERFCEISSTITLTGPIWLAGSVATRSTNFLPRRSERWQSELDHVISTTSSISIGGTTWEPIQNTFAES